MLWTNVSSLSVNDAIACVPIQDYLPETESESEFTSPCRERSLSSETRAGEGPDHGLSAIKKAGQPTGPQNTLCVVPYRTNRIFNSRSSRSVSTSIRNGLASISTAPAARASATNSGDA